MASTQTQGQAPSTGIKSPSTMSSMMWFKAPPAVYFGWACTEEALKDLRSANIRKVFFIADRNVQSHGHLKVALDAMEQFGIDYDVFCDVPAADYHSVCQVMAAMRNFRPDAIVAVGGGVVMDIAKICRIIYDPSNKITSLKDLYAYDHMQLLSDQEEKTGVSSLPPCNVHIKKLVCIPTTSSTGSEMTPIAWVTEEGIKRPIVSWRMTPDIAVNDGIFTASLPRSLVVSGGLNALTNAVESAVSRLSNDYTFSLSVQATRLIFSSLVNSAKVGDHNSRCDCHNAASIAGLASANAFVGIAHALSFVLQRYFTQRSVKTMSQGMTSALVLSQVVRFNARHCTAAADKYGQIAVGAGLVGDRAGITIDCKVDKLIEGIESLKSQLGMDKSIKDVGIETADFAKDLERLAKEALNVVGCATTNPVTVTKENAMQLFKDAFDGKTT